jgi:hypothetical protein
LFINIAPPSIQNERQLVFFEKWVLMAGAIIACKERKTTGIRAPRKRLVALESSHSSVGDKKAHDGALADRRCYIPASA